jgi:transmembrane sensor
MTEPAAKLKAAMAQVKAPWDAARTERTLPGLARKSRARRGRALLGTGIAAALAIGGVFWLVQRPPPESAQQPSAQRGSVGTSATAAPQQQLHLPDGSKVQLLDPHTDVILEQSADGRIALRVHAGRARFDIEAPERVLEVRTAQVVVEALGSVFELSAGVERTWVRVELGSVVAVSQAGRRELSAGQESWFAASTPHALTGEPVSSERKPIRRASAHPVQSANQGADDWRERAERGEFREAFPLLPQPEASAQMDVSELLLAADAARLSGHPRAALPFLQRVVEHHARDARAPLAAFTLGGVLMNQLGMPREAEAAYAKARASALGSALAQDALARQVEAAHRAGDDALARQLARDYLEHYPQGRRVRAVRRFGGL